MIKNNKGIALATLVVTVIIMVMISGTIVYTSLDTMKLRKLDDMNNDIRLLKQKVQSYYIDNNKLPILGDAISTSELPEEIRNNNPNDDENRYYVINLEELNGVTLKFGKEYKEYANDKNKKDVYIINEATHTVYYLKGIEVNEEEKRYFIEESYGEIETPGLIAYDKNGNIIEDFLENWTYSIYTEGGYGIKYIGDVDENGKIEGEVPYYIRNGWEEENVVSYREMFKGRTDITKLDVSNFKTDKVINMDYMFVNCSALTELNVSSFDTSNVTTMLGMFEGCSILTELDLSNFNTSNVGCMSFMFSRCNKLETLNLNNFNTSNVARLEYMFNYCTSLKSLDLSNFVTSKVGNMSYMFTYCSSLESLDISTFNTSNVTTMRQMFSYCAKVQQIIGLTTDTLNTSFNTEKVTDMAYMFNYCNELTELDVSNFNTINVKDMECMFFNCAKLSNLDISSFVTYNETNNTGVTNMSYMFGICKGLTELDLSNFDTRSVTKMNNMFYECTGLAELDISSFDTSNVTNMSRMFYGCIKLAEINLNNFNTEKVENMSEMFCINTGLTTSIQLGAEFVLTKVSDMTDMFYYLNTSDSIYVTNAETRTTLINNAATVGVTDTSIFKEPIT